MESFAKAPRIGGAQETYDFLSWSRNYTLQFSLDIVLL